MFRVNNIHCKFGGYDVRDVRCDDRTINYAITCAHRRTVAHRDETSVLAHGEVDEWNA